MNIGITGLTSAGKSMLFSSFTGTGGDASNVTTGIVKIPDERLDRLSALFNPKKHTNTTVKFEDCPAMDSPVKQDKIKLYDTLKTMDALVAVIGAYQRMSPEEAIAEFKQYRFELMMNDLDFVVKRIERLEREILKIAKNRAERERELHLMQRLQPILEAEKTLQDLTFDDIEKEILGNANLVTMKPVCYVFNISENTDEAYRNAVEQQAAKIIAEAGENSPVFVINASLEAELAGMEPEEMAEFLQEYGIKESGRERVIKAAYGMLDLITFFTVGEDECRGWTLRKGGTAVDAAGTIHSDLARGFIRAEIIEQDVLLELKTMAAAKKAGKLRLEGRNYIVKDGDIAHIMFNT